MARLVWALARSLLFASYHLRLEPAPPRLSPCSPAYVMFPTRFSPTPPARPSSVAHLPFKYRRKSFSEDNPDYYLLPPSPSLSPSRSLSMSSSPPSSPTTLATSPARPSYLDTAVIHPPSSPTRPSAFHGYGYAYSYSRLAPTHDYDLASAEHHGKPSQAVNHRPYAIIPPPSTSTRSSFSASSPSVSDGFSAVFSSASDRGASHGTCSSVVICCYARTVSVLRMCLRAH